MTAREKFDAAALAAVMGAQAPGVLDRRGRIRLIGEGAKALLDGRLPGRESALFIGGALLSWLQTGGSLERDFLRVVKAKSHHTPDVLWRFISDERQATDGSATMAATSPEQDHDVT